jgi:cytochrome c peroxidase
MTSSRTFRGQTSTSSAFYRLVVNLPSTAEALPRTIALFKTPTVRDLSHSGPYLHTGRMDSFEDVIRFYQEFSKLARQSRVRNADPELSEIRLNQSAIAPLAAFLRSLNEDYTD